MSDMARALVQQGVGVLEWQQLPIPDELPPGSAVIEVLANGLCHTDVDGYDGVDPLVEHDRDRYPRIMGHEIVGRIERLGPPTPDREHWAVGDLVALNPFNSCGGCRYCRADDRAQCEGWPTPSNLYGFIPTTEWPGLWGGYATHVYVHPNAIVYRFEEHVDPLDASLWNLLGGGIQWGVMNPGLQAGDSVAVLGCGQRGLACLAAVEARGAGTTLISGLSVDAHKLALGREFGADVAVDVEQEDLVARGRELVPGGFDIVIDTTPHSLQPVRDALDLLRPGGTLVIVGIKTTPMDAFPVDKVTTRGIRIIGSLGQSHAAYTQAARMINDGGVPLHRMRTHVVPLSDLAYAVRLVRGELPEERPVNVVVVPDHHLS